MKLVLGLLNVRPGQPLNTACATRNNSIRKDKSKDSLQSLSNKSTAAVSSKYLKPNQTLASSEPILALETLNYPLQSNYLKTLQIIKNG